MLHPIGCLQPSSVLCWARHAALSAAIACAGITTVQAQISFTLPPSSTMIDVTTYAYDNGRTGFNPGESLLTPSSVNPFNFGQIFNVPVDGAIYAQPLYLHNLAIPGHGNHNVVFVATENDSVYAFDADKPGAPLWKDSFINSPNYSNPPANSVTTLSSNDVGTMDISPQLGITGTPVIDPTTGTLYVVVNTKETNLNNVTTFVQRLHALDVHTGAEKFGGPVVIQGSVPGTGDASVNVNNVGTVSFDPLINNQRPALLLLNGVVYIGWASHGDNGPYHGWVMGYNASTLAQTTIWNTTPNAYTPNPGNDPLAAGGIWMGGSGLAADASGNIFLSTGNGTFDNNPLSQTYPAYGDSILKLSTTGGHLSVNDYFTPFDQQALDDGDADLGSGGVMLLPDNVSFNGATHLLVQAGKEGTVYLVNRDNMGKYDVNGNHVAQFLGGAIGGVWGKPSYFSMPSLGRTTVPTIYFGGVGDVLRAFQIQPVTSATYGGPTTDMNGAPDITTFDKVANVSFNGTAALNSTSLRLTSGSNNQAGSAFGKQQANISRFYTEFDFTMTGMAPTGNGITFTLQGAGYGAVGSNGAGLGYSGITPSVAIKWDQVDPNTGKNATGLFINGTLVSDISLQQAAINLTSGDTFQVQISYNGALLEVTTLDLTTTAFSVQRYSVNIPMIIGSKLGYVGFTGSTGGYTSTQSVLKWWYSAPTLSQQQLTQSDKGDITFGYPGPSPVITARDFNGRDLNPIVWAIQSDQSLATSPILYAFDATNLSNILYSSGSANENPPGTAVKFTVPVVANGKVYVGSSNALTVFGPRYLAPGP